MALLPFAAGKTKPAGSNTLIQFNNNGVFGADSNLNWDNLNKFLRIGTGTIVAPLTVTTDFGTLAVFQRNAATTSFSQVDIVQPGGSQGNGDGFSLIALGSAYTTSGAFKQDGALFLGNAGMSGGFSICASASGAALRFYTGGVLDSNERMRITSNATTGGSTVVGIATTTTKATLQVGDTGALFYNNNTGASSQVSLGRNVYQNNTGLLKRIVADKEAPLLQLTTNGQFQFWHETDSGNTADSTITYGLSMVIDDLGNVGIQQGAPLSKLHIAAGSATANTAPLQFDSGTLETVARAGVVEFLTDDLYFTITTGAARKGFVLNDGTNLTSGRVPFATTNGRLTDSTDLTFGSSTLTTTGLVVGTGKVSSYNGVATTGYGIPALVDTKSLTTQSADIADTNFTNAGTAGLYRVSYYVVDTAADLTAGAVQLNIKFNDGAASQTISSSTVVLTTLGAFTQGVMYVRLGSGSITYGVTHTGIFGTATYALYASVERLN